MLKFRFVILYITCIFTIMGNLVSSDDIPTMLWNIKGNFLVIKPVSALGNDDQIFSESLEEIFHQDASVLVFAVNKLSLEDFSANEKPATLNNTLNNIEKFLDFQPHMLLPSIKNPLNYIHKAHCGVQEIVVDNKIDENVIQSVSKAMQRSCVVILHVSDDGIVAKEDQIKTVFSPSLVNSNKNVVGVFTGVKSSWAAPDNDHHVFRNLLSVESSRNNFMNYSGCMIMYASNATVSIEKDNATVELSFPPSLDGSSCNSSTLELAFETTGSITSVTLIFDFKKVGSSWKAKTFISVVGKVDYEKVELNSEIIDAPVGFSYSCGKIVFNEKNSSYGITVTLDRFQIQPYEVKNVFSDSFDCVTFFTIPIWMGIFIGLLFIAILEIGIYALYSVHTMDRFDDPKGKTISVPTATD